MRKILLLFYCILIGLSPSLFAGLPVKKINEVPVSGKVTSTEGEELVGVNIVIKGTSNGTITDVNGNFTINVPDNNSVLIVSYIGFNSEEVTIGNQTVINVKLTPNLASLSEVVVVGYGTQLRSQITGAVSSIKTQEITQTPVTRIEQSLQGRLAGVTVINQSGQPGDQPQVRIRGTGTTGNADPLYIVDGIPVGGIDFINPGDIETMSVLKDAASSAIYGARGANGVVLITTRTGKRNEKLSLTYDGYYGTQNPWRKMPVLNAREYAIMQNEGAINGGRSIPFPDVTKYGEGTDWQDALFNKNAPMHSHQFSVAGGGQNSDFATTLSYLNQEGIVGGDKSQFERYTFRTNANFNVSKRFKTGINVAYTRIDRASIVSNLEYGGLLNNAINLDPITPLYETDTTILKTYNPNAVKDGDKVFGISKNVGQEVVNPLARLAVTNEKTRVDKLVGSVYGEYEFLKGLKLRSSLGVELSYVTKDNFTPIFYLNAANLSNQTSVSKRVDWSFQWINTNTLTYNKKIGDHNVEGMIGIEALKEVFNDVFASKNGLPSNDPNYAYLDLAATSLSDKVSGSFRDHALFSLFGRLNYNFKEKYMLSAVIRRDGSSRFGENHLFATFPSFSAGWNISQEPFLEDITAISLLKLRASWGQNGSEFFSDNYPSLNVVESGRGYTYINDKGEEVYTGGAAPSRPANPELLWETSEQTDFGLDISLFNNKINITTDYYIKKTKGLIVAAPIYSYLGYPNAPGVNGGTVENKGLEFALDYNDQVGDFKYTLGFNATYNKNKVTEISNLEKRILGPSFVIGSPSRTEVGQPIASFFGYKTDGIFQNEDEVNAYSKGDKLIQPAAGPGDVRFVDLNNDGSISDDDRTYIGNPIPQYIFGFNLKGEYKGLDLSLFFNGVYGNEIFNGTRRHDLYMSNMPAKFLNRWTGEGSTNSMPRFTSNDVNGNWSKISDLYLEDGSYLRLRNIQLGYNIPALILNASKIEKIRIYISADNLLTFTKYTGFDPEVGARINNGNLNPLDLGIDRGVYPQAKSFRVGASITF